MLTWRVLVVEDEFLIRLVLGETLSDEGFEVIEAATGEEAIQLIDDPDGCPEGAMALQLLSMRVIATQ